jgi:hypothetical protein
MSDPTTDCSTLVNFQNFAVCENDRTADSTSLIAAHKRDESRKNAGCNDQEATGVEKLNSNRPANRETRE